MNIRKLLACIFVLQVYAIFAMELPKRQRQQKVVPALSALDAELLGAVELCDALKVTQLIGKGANKRLTTAKGLSLLHVAAGREACTDVITLLQKEGLAVDSLDLKGHLWTPLHMAAMGGKLNNVKRLIKLGAKLDSEDAKKFTPLHYAANIGYPDTVKFLIESGADTSLVNNGNRTALQMAVQRNKPEVLKAFLTSVQPVDIQHVIPGIIVLTKKEEGPGIGRDVMSIIKKEWYNDIIQSKLATAKVYLHNVPDNELRQAIIESIDRVIANSTYIKSAEPH